MIVANTWRRCRSWLRHYIKQLAIKNKYFKERRSKHKCRNKTLKFEAKDHNQLIGIARNVQQKYSNQTTQYTQKLN